ncbi:cholinesterase 1-like [Culicoides brevitarsis]|uniref:cholinesterase 1-like n=1 Tax=Culicoides brevitarsis TaxID=469753 RepID=UPI00307B552E
MRLFITFSCIFLSLFEVFLLIKAESLIVETSTGPVEGIRTPGKCKEANAWYGIPYAKPPVGELRYKRPVPVEPWSDILKTKKKPNACHQQLANDDPVDPGLFTLHREHLSEDCLYLNVVSPVEREGKLPVMVWIHGGSFTSGGTRMHLYDTECLSNYGEVVTVSIGYRVANLGFLYLGEDTAPGNLALLDQQLALKWIKENIENFGGDPDQITIHGQSAGGSSISFHLLSEGSKDLFKHAIVQSGAAYCPWSWISNERARENTKKFAARVGCTDTSSDEVLLKCLQEVDAQKLVESEEHPDVPEFPPTIDGLFIKKDPWTVQRETDFTGRSVMIGTTSEEGDVYGFSFLMKVGVDEKNIPQNVTEQNAKDVLDVVVDALSHDIPEGTAQKVLDFYAEKTNKNYFNVVSQGAIGDPLLDCPVNDFADGLAKNGAKVYKYVFAHHAKYSPWAQRGLGAAHCEELLFMFGEPLRKDAKLEFSLFEKLLAKRTIGYWTDFAKTGEVRRNMLQKWPLYDEKDKKYVQINLLGTSVEENFRGEYCEFFKNEL